MLHVTACTNTTMKEKHPTLDITTETPKDWNGETRYVFEVYEVDVRALAAGEVTPEVLALAAGLLEPVVPLLPLDRDDVKFLARHRAQQHRTTAKLRQENERLKAGTA